jgi:predicted RNA methylase
MSGQEFEDLVADIREHGLLDPILLTKDEKILDGRNRFAACLKAKVEPEFFDWEPARNQTEIDYVISVNLKRRHLNESQRAMVAAKAKPFYDGEAADNRKAGAAAAGSGKDRADLPSPSGRSRDKAGKAVNVSGRSVAAAEKVQSKGSKKLVKAVEDGTVGVTSAEYVCDRPHKEQDAIVDMLRNGDAKNIRQAARKLDEHKRVKAAKGKSTGDVRVVQADCLEALAKSKVKHHCVVMDPPYGVDATRARRPSGRDDVRVDVTGEKDYEDGPEHAEELLHNVCAVLQTRLTKDAHGYCFSGYSYAWLFKAILEEYFEVQDNPLIWVKENHTMADFAQAYPSRHEYIWFFKMPEGKKRKLAACVPDVLMFPRDNHTTHSAEKPVALIRTLLEQSTVAGEKVVDPFVGGGSTLVACKDLGRTGVGYEIDEDWAAVAASRLV